MARRRNAESDDVSLFPFMSILASIIGVLTLLIASMALAQMDNSTVVMAEQYEKLRKKIAPLEKDIQALEQQVSESSGNMGVKQKEIAENRERLEELLTQLKEVQLKSEELGEPVDMSEVDTAAQRQDIEKVQIELKQLQEQVAQLELELEDRKKPPRESAVTILPSGSGKGFEPIFVECASGSVVLHSTDPPQRIRQADLAADPQFEDFCKQTLASENLTIVFLVRDEGLATYRSARSLANSRDARHGKLPVVGDGRIDLSYFREKKQSR